jgi:Dolichyl-phosphate-mannose-protein mannosyltransferase
LNATATSATTKLLQQLDLIIVVFLGVVSFSTLFFLLVNSGKAMFNIDSYTYLSTAVSIAKGSSEYSANPFINIISLAIKVSTNLHIESLLPLRILNIVFAVQLVVLIYLIARKIFDHFFSTLTAVMALFLPLFQSYSITLHDDIFAISMGFASLYFIMKPKLANIVLATAFFTISILTRYDMLPIFVIPFVFGIVTFIRNKTGWNLNPISSGLIVILLIEIAYIAAQGYYHSITRFNPLERFIVFVRPDIIQLALKNSIAITGNQLLDNIYLGSIIFGISLFIFVHRAKLVAILRSKEYRLKEVDTAAVYLTFAFLTSFISLVAFHINYSIVDDKVVFNPVITPRYFIPVQLFMVYAFTFTFSSYSLRNLQSIKNLVSQKLIRIKPRNM